jgi:prevent-host-death family protein
MRRIGSYEAKTHLPRLLRAVEDGETITITKRGVPIAVLSPAEPAARASISEAAAALRTFRTAHRLDGLTIRELIDEGRA